MLIDSSVAIDILRNYQPAIAFFSALSDVPRLAAPTVTELFAGVKGRREQDVLDGFISAAIVLACDLDIAKAAGGYVRKYRPSHSVSPMDAMIAATATRHVLPLATLNIKHFPMFPGLERPY